MSLYESVLIVRQETSTQQVEALADSCENIIQENGGSVKKRENWGLRSLAYKIKKNRKGHYLLFNIEGPANAVQEFERRMRLNEDVLRYLTIKVDALDEGPSIPAQNLARVERTAQDYNNDKSEATPTSEAVIDDGEKKQVNVDEDIIIENKSEGEN